MSRDRRQVDFYCWAVEVFGPIAADPHERASRFLEEAIELAHAVGLNRERVDGLTARVYSRSRGDVAREAGQVGITLLALCECLGRLSHGMSAETEELREWARVTSIPAEEWRARQQAKAQQGLALPCEEPRP